LPLGYTVRFNDDPRHQLAMDLPITFQSVEGGHVYGLAAGMGYSHPINDIWALTGAVDYGMSRSDDLGSNGHLITGTLTSLLALPLAEGVLLNIGNLIGHSDTLRSFGGDFACDPKIHNLIIKNGVMAYFATPRLLRSSGFEVFVSDARYFGTPLYDSGYTEIGVSFGISSVELREGVRYDTVLRGGVSGIIARGNSGVTLNMGYVF